MPGMDGIALVKELKRAFPANTTQPYILMLSPYREEYLPARSRQTGISKFLSKPVKMHEL